MGYSANRKTELVTNNNTLTYSQKRKLELDRENQATQAETTTRGLELKENKDAFMARDAQARQEIKPIKKVTTSNAVDDFQKKADETKWYEPKVGLVKDFFKLDSGEKQEVARKATESMAKSPFYAAADAAADSLTLGARPTIQKAIYGKVPNGEDYLQMKKETKENNPVASTVGTIVGYVAPGALAEKVAAKALAPILSKVGSKVAQKAITGAVTGGGMELVEGAIRGETPEEIANRTIAGAGYGAAGDVAFYGLGKGITAIANKIKAGKVLTESEKAIAKNTPELLLKLSNEIVPEAKLTMPETDISQPKILNQKEWVDTLQNLRTKSTPQATTSPIQPLKLDLGTNGQPISNVGLKQAEGLIPTGELKERGLSKNIRTDINRPDAERAIFDTDPEFYNVLNNETTLSAAQKRFAQGYETALKDFDATKGKLRADNVPLAKLIADEAVKRGDVATARRVLVDVSESLTSAGQYSQAAKILRESNDPSAVIDFIDREIRKLNTQGTNRYGKRWKNIDLAPEELNKLKEMPTNMTDEQKEQLFNEIGDSITSRIPTTAREKFDSWRRIAMLFNPKTHIRNVAGNSMMAGMKQLSDKVAATLELGLKPEQRTKVLKVGKEYKDIASQYWDANKKALTEGSRWEIFGVKSPFAEKATFKTKWLETLNDVSKNTLEKEDIMFMKYHFNNNLAGFLQARRLKEPTQEAVEYATKRAQEATFREANALADAINKLKGTKGGLIIEAAIPFTKTPANILSTGVKYSPLGFINSAVQLISKEDPSKAIETFSKALTGSGLTMMGYYMSKNGLARGEYEKNAKVEGLKQAAGELPNSITTPKGSFTLDWAQPASIPFFMGVGMAESLKKNGGSDYVQAGFDALKAGGDTLINQSMLKNIKDLFGGYGSATEKVMQLPVNYLQQAFPTIGGQVARTLDPFKRQTDYSSNSSQTLTGLQGKTPVLSKDLPLKRDVLGQPQKYGEGVLNAIQQFISPGYIAKKNDDPIIAELNRLYQSEGSEFLPRATVYKFTKDKTDYELSNSEISEFQKIMGEYTKENLNALFSNPNYKSMTDADKAKAIKRINDDGYELAKQEIINSR